MRPLTWTLMLLVVGSTVAFLFVPFDERGCVRRPRPPAASSAPKPRAPLLEASPAGVARGIEFARADLDACHRSFGGAAPESVTLTVTPNPDGTASITAARLDLGEDAWLEDCFRSVLIERKYAGGPAEPFETTVPL